MIVDRVPEPRERLLEMFLEQEAGVIGADGDAHDDDCTCVLGSSFVLVRRSRGDRATDQPERRTLLSPMIPSVIISARGEERLRGGHPWIYRADVADVRAAAGDIVLVRARAARWSGRALFSDRSQITLRMLTHGEQPADAALRAAADRGGRSRSARRWQIDATAYRLVHGEADLLPSLIVDRYGDYLVVQALSQGMDRLLPADRRRR